MRVYDPTRIPIGQAIALYLEMLKKQGKQTGGTLRNIRVSLHNFRKMAKAQYIQGVTVADIQRFIYKYPDKDYNLRRFLEWVNSSLNLNLYVPPRKAAKQIRPRPAQSVCLKKIDLWKKNAEVAARRLLLPHQRAIYALGYFRGLSLRDQLRLTADDIAQMPLAGEFGEIMARVASSIPQGNNPALEQWIGHSYSTAWKRWRSWVGPDIPFAHVVGAGAARIYELNARPPMASKKLMSVLHGSRARADETIMEMMERVWR